jgi:hypothetical protein
MKKSLFTILLLLPVLAWAAQSPFVGVWNFAPVQFDTPPPLAILLQDGIFQDPSANPSIKIKADGADQPNPPDSKTDTLAVKIVDDKTVEMIFKRDGKVALQVKYMASADGKTITTEFPPNPEAGKQSFAAKSALIRVASGPAGSHAISGTWRMPAPTLIKTVVFKSSPDGLIMSSLTAGKDIKVDGKDYPMTGIYGFQGMGRKDNPGITVSLTQVNERTIRQTGKKDGKIEVVFTYTVSDDGKTLTEKREERGATTTDIATKLADN